MYVYNVYIYAFRNNWEKEEAKNGKKINEKRMIRFKLSQFLQNRKIKITINDCKSQRE